MNSVTHLTNPFTFEVGRSKATDLLKKYKVWLPYIGKRPIDPHCGYFCPFKGKTLADHETWFEEAVKGYNTFVKGKKPGGLTISLNPQKLKSGFSGLMVTAIDLDHCVTKETKTFPANIDQETGEVIGEEKTITFLQLSDFAIGIVNQVGGHWQLSTSETGLHGFCLCNPLPKQCNGHRVIKENGQPIGEIEIYQARHTMNVTGKNINGTSDYLDDCSIGLAFLYERYFAPKPQPPMPPRPLGQMPASRSDQTVLDKMLSSRDSLAIALFNGETKLHGDDHSAADLALCSKLIFWTNRNYNQVDSLFRQSRLMRADKWDKVHTSDGRTYGQMTIDKAFSKYQDFRRFTS